MSVLTQPRVINRMEEIATRLIPGGWVLEDGLLLQGWRIRLDSG